MKTRTIVGVTAIPLFLLLIFFAPLWGYAIVVGLICGGCSWEFLRCVDPDMKPRFKYYAFGVAFALVIAITLAKTDLVAVGFAGSSTPGELVSLGMMAAMGLQVACYLVVWAGWWLSKR